MPTSRTEVPITPEPASPPRVTCRGVSPDPRKRGQPCGRLLAIVATGRFRFVGITARAADAPGRFIYVLCTRKGCHVWNVFELLPADADGVA